MKSTNVIFKIFRFCIIGILTNLFNWTSLYCQTGNLSKTGKLDSTKTNLSNNSFSLILEVGRPNIFNFLGTKYLAGFSNFSSTQLYPSKTYYDAFELSIQGMSAFSAGFAFNHKLPKLSNLLFNKDSKYFLTFKNEFLFSSMNYKPKETLKILIPGTLIKPFQPVNLDFNDFNIQRVNYSPSFELSKKLKIKNNLIIYGFGPVIIVLENDFKNLNFQNFNEIEEIYGGQFSFGYQINKIKVKLKYELFIPPIYLSGSGKLHNPTVIENSFIGMYQYKRIESLNLGVEFKIK